MPTCLEWGNKRSQECSQTEDQGYDECSASEDRGYSACSASEDRGHNECCDWWPCSWACDALVWISNIVCVAWTWVSNVVCVAWTWVSNVVCVAWIWITTAICVLWDSVVAVWNVIAVVVEGFFGVVLSGIAAIIELIEAIPLAGPIIRIIINIVTSVIWGIVSAVDFVAGLIGIRPEKKLRVCTVILKDENGNALADKATVVQALQLAATVYKRDANIRLMPMGLFQYRQGFSDEDTVTADWVQIDASNGDADTLSGPCGVVHLGGAASAYQLKMTSLCFVGAWRRVLGYGAPVTVFIIRSFNGICIGRANLGDDYVRVVTVDTAQMPPLGGLPPASPRTIGHEIGHTCMLLHRCVDEDKQNMMGTQDECSPASKTNPDRGNPRFTDWQALVMRASKHVTYF